MASHAETKIDCSKVYVKQSSFSNEDTGMFDGAFAAVDIKEGELVEKGLMRRLPEGFDGNTCPYIFTWSTERPNKVSLPYVLLSIVCCVGEGCRRVFANVYGYGNVRYKCNGIVRLLYPRAYRDRSCSCAL